MRYRSAPWVVLLLLLAGCAGPATPPVPATLAQPGVPPTEMLPADVPLPPTSVPPATPAATPTPIVVQSLTAAELHERLDPFGSAEAACPLPCYSGLVVGQASLPDVLAFYARLGIGPDDLIPGDYEAARDGTGRLGAWLNKASDQVQAEQAGHLPPLVDIYLEDDVLQYVYVGWGYSPAYLSPARVLATLGQPAQVDLGRVPGADAPTYLLRMIYPAQQAGFAFYGAIQSGAGGEQACFSADDVQRTFLGVFAPGVPTMEGLTGAESLAPLEQALGIPVQDFAAQVGAGGCLPAPPE